MSDDLDRANRETQAAWNANAAYWDEKMQEGNSFVNVLIWPTTERLLGLQPGERVLDIGCGNGLYARKVAALGAEVVAFDFSADLVAHAEARTAEHKERIRYHVLDATDERALLSLGEGQFDAAMCNMVLFDVAQIAPLARALPRLLAPNGRFVFSVMHPCFNHSRMAHSAECSDQEGQIVTSYWIKVSGYISPCMSHGAAIAGQPQAQLYFHRPLQELLGTFFATGFVLDALHEPTFPPDEPSGRNPLTWGGHYSEIPPVLIARMRQG
jgi:2-polyprenyl-3-methyl-5-hydroxy-6-metoxy-1,4-benzoquinol methylase